MKKPTRILVWMTLFLLVIALICVLFWQPVSAAFAANHVFNAMILVVFALGVIINFRQVASLGPEVRWIVAFRDGRISDPEHHQRGLLAPMARMLTGRTGEGFSLSTLSMSTLLDGIRSRMEESRDLSRYVIGLLVFLGLLGTFWGLLDTLRSVGDVIDTLSVEGDDIGAIFVELKTGLQEPLYGMGTAFSSSLFGLAGSLILGFLDLQAGHAQTRFINELEEWLSGLTRLSSGHLFGEGEQSSTGYTQALLEQTAENLDKLQRALARNDEERRGADQALQTLATQLTALTDQIRSEQKLMLSLAKRQSDLQPLLQALAENANNVWNSSEESQQHLRSMDNSLSRILEDATAHRIHMIDELRKEIRLLSKTVAQLPLKADTGSNGPHR